MKFESTTVLPSELTVLLLAATWARKEETEVIDEEVTDDREAATAIPAVTGALEADLATEDDHPLLTADDLRLLTTLDEADHALDKCKLY